jgi:acetyltransferase
MRSARGRVIGERDTAALLAAYEIPMARASLARSPAEALRQAAAIGYPVVLKAASPLLPHKSDVGGVVLGVRSAAEVRRGYRAIVARVRRVNPEVALEGILVAEMVPPGLEIMLGVSTGPYGSMVLVGHGGTDVEVARDVAYALTPVDSEEALAMLKRLRLFPRLAPSRDRPARDVAAVVEMIVNVSRVAEECGAWLAALDINPVIVHASGDGVRAVDALCILRDTL